MDAKLRTDRAALKQAALPPGAPVVAPGGAPEPPAPPAPAPPASQAPPKVAFLFLVRTEVALPEVWDEFFSQAPRNQYSVYVHQAAADAGTSRLERWGAASVPRVPTEWCATFGAEVVLLSEALRDPDNVQFVFVSDSTVPLKSFGYVYQQLAGAAPRTSKFCLSTPAAHSTVRMECLTSVASSWCVYRDFYRGLNPHVVKHHQWVVLARSHASALVRHAAEALDVFEATWRQAAADVVTGDGCSDEAAPLAALLLDLPLEGNETGNDIQADMAHLGLEQQCLTYVHWYGCLAGTPLDNRSLSEDLVGAWHHKEDVWKLMTQADFNFGESGWRRELNGFPVVFDTISLDHLRRLTASTGFLFARKMLAGTVVTDPGAPAKPLGSLGDVLPRLWGEVVAEEAAKLVWSRLDVHDQPGAQE